MVTASNPLARAALPRWPLAPLLFLAQLGFSVQAAEELTLAVAPGDTLIGISQRYLAEPGRWPELKRLNRVRDDLQLKPGSSLRIPLAWLRWSERSADIIHVQGLVSAIVAGAAPGAGGHLAAGMQLKAGDSFDTGASGTLTLRLPDGAIVVFPPQTRAGLGVSRQVAGTALRATAIELQNGSADSSVPPLTVPASRFEIRTPRVVTAVRGTRFRVAADGAISRHEVVSGVVAVGGAAGTARLDAVQGLRAEAGRLGTVLPLLPAADVSGVPLRIERSAQPLDVPALDGAQAWRWQVAADAAFTQLLQDERTTAPSWLLTGLPDGDYHLRLRAADAQGLEGQEAQLALALRARPESPILLSPAPGASVAPGADLLWTGQADAPAYQLQVAREAGFAELVLDRPGVSGHQLPLPADWTPGTYHWRVATLRAPGDRGLSGDGPRGPFGDSASFTLLAPSAMAAPELGEGGLTLAWSGPAGFSHRVQLAPDADFSRTEFDQVVPGARLELPTPPPGAYFVRTQVVLSEGRAGSWSSAQRLDVPTKRHPWALLLLLLPLL
ncbi:MAG: FecR domain-containing protein [Rhodoferax sp.]